MDYNNLLSNNDLIRFSTSNKSFDNKILRAVKMATKQVISMRKKEGNDIQKEFVKYIKIAKKAALEGCERMRRANKIESTCKCEMVLYNNDILVEHENE